MGIPPLSRGAGTAFRRATYDGAGNSPDGPWPCADLLSEIFRTPIGRLPGNKAANLVGLRFGR